MDEPVHAAVETAMSSEPSVPRDPLATSVLSLAGLADLHARLDVIAREAAGVVPGSVAAIYLLDDDARSLRAAAAHPLDPDALPSIEVSGDAGEADAAVRAINDRHEVVALAGGTLESAFPAAGAAHAVVHLPLVIQRKDEGPDVEGVLAVSTPSAPPEGAPLETLRALAALAALVSVQARYEAALDERSDWFDRLAHTDALTGLANRRTLDRVLDLELARAARQDSALCVAIFGVNHQEAVAQRRGAHAADDVLRRVAASLAETVRLVDTVARYGRAEFVVVAPGSTGLAMAQRAASAIGRIEPAAGDPPIEVSVGVATFPLAGTTIDDVLGAAERALAQAREQGEPIVTAS